MHGAPVVVITGMGAVTPLGANLSSSCDAATQRTGLRTITNFEGTPFEGRLGAPIVETQLPRGAAAISFAESAIAEALGQAGAALGVAALIVGTSLTPEDPLVDEFVASLKRRHGELTTIVVTSACASGLHAMLCAQTLLQSRQFDVVIAGASDEISLSTFAGFHALGLLSATPTTPFGGLPGAPPALGTNLGEGAAFFVLERRASALARGASIVATLEGIGVSADAHHATSPHPSGEGLTRAACQALREAQRAAEEIACVSAHATGTRANDEAEYAALVTLFGPRANVLPITVSKSLVGHSLGAASAVELAMALEAMRRGEISPSAKELRVRPPFELDLVIEARPFAGGPLLKLGAGFGGFNAAAVLSVGDRVAGTVVESGTTLQQRPLAVLAMGGFGGAVPERDPLGSELDLLVDAGSFDFESLTRTLDSRGLDRTTQMLATAFQRATRNTPRRTSEGHRTATFVGQRRASPENGRAFNESVDARGYRNVSGSAFARKVLTTATGSICRMFALRGPTFVLTTGPASGLVALALAADQLAYRDDADLAFAAAVEERDLNAPRAVVDGAACFLLGREHGPEPSVSLASWAVGADEEAALAALLARSPRPRFERLRASPDSQVPAVAGLLACGVAVTKIAREEAETVVVSAPGRLASACVMFERWGHR